MVTIRYGVVLVIMAFAGTLVGLVSEDWLATTLGILATIGTTKSLEYREKLRQVRIDLERIQHQVCEVYEAIAQIQGAGSPPSEGGILNLADLDLVDSVYYNGNGGGNN